MADPGGMSDGEAEGRRDDGAGGDEGGEYYADEDLDDGEYDDEDYYDEEEGGYSLDSRGRQYRHESTGWDVRLPIMEEVKYCGCLSWVVGCLLLPFFCGCVCCCPIDKKMRPKKYVDKTCSESFWDFMQPKRRRAEMEALDERRDYKWNKAEGVEEREAEMDNDQKMADDRGEATTWAPETPSTAGPQTAAAAALSGT